MKLTKQEQETVKYYDENSLEWAQKHGLGEKVLLFEKQMRLLFKLVPKGKILEIGSGHGKDAKRLIEHFSNENYTGVDASKGLIEIASQTNPNARFIHTSVYDLEDINCKFDCAWVSAMLIHIPKSRINKALLSIKSKMNLGAYCFFSILEGNADMENFRANRYYSLYSQEEFACILESKGFEIKEMDIVDTLQESRWLTYICRVV